MAMSPLRKISIGARALLAPFLLAVAMVGIVMLLWTTYRTIEHGNVLSFRAGLAIEQARHFADELHQGHTALYRAISLKSQGVEQRIVSERTSTAVSSLDNAARALQKLAELGAVADISLLDHTREAFGAYVVTAREAADFVETEAFVAAMYLNGADRKFVDAQTSASAIGAALAAQRERIDQEAANILKRAFNHIGTATALAILLSLAVAVSFARLVGAQARAVTETTAANDKLRSAFSQLEQQSGELTWTAKRLEAALVAAEAANRAKSLFLANMSHELRTPLNAILGYAQLFKRDQRLIGWQAEAVDTIQRSGEHLLTLISDILDLSKIEAGKLELSSGIVDLRGFVRDLGNITQVRTDAKGLSFVREISADLPHFVQADEKRLRQVLLNLLGNAAKFTDFGQVELRVSALSTSENQAKLRFEVKDSGIGIEAEKLEAIFKPFEQVCDPRHQSGGAGLGLSISRQLLRLMGSEIEVESVPGQGSRFWFDVSLPQASAQPAPLPPAINVTGYLGRRRNILIVDDTPENRAVLAVTLTGVGFEIHEAVNGLDGLERAVTTQPDLILLDIMMPVMDGLEMTRRIREIGDSRSIPIVAVSASVAAEDQSRSLAAGANAFLAKPIDHKQLFHLIGTLLQLDWVENPLQPAAPADGETDRLVAPPLAELDVLYDLARAGNMRNIRKQADRIASLDERYRPFADKLRQLARAFDSKGILRLVEDSLDQQQTVAS
jgi:signal transduction histidine kinase/FixJ family two-component response regulator